MRQDFRPTQQAIVAVGGRIVAYTPPLRRRLFVLKQRSQHPINADHGHDTGAWCALHTGSRARETSYIRQ